MSYEANDNFTPDRDRVADADAAVPVIDIAPFVHGDAAARRMVVAAVKRACEQVGFFVITGHGVPDDKIKAAFGQGRAFFARPLDEKMRIKRPGPGISRGYNSLAGQSLALTTGQKAPPDLMESLGFGPLQTDEDPYWTAGFGPVHAHPNLWPAGMPQFRDAVSDYWRAMEALSARLMRIFALGARSRGRVLRPAQQAPRHQHAHQLLPGAGSPARGGATARRRPFRLRRIHHPQGRERSGRAPGLRRGGDWADVPLIDAGFIINIGDLLMRWTNDKWVSTIHRVVNPPEEVRRGVDRMSIAYFFVPDHDVEVRCFDSCMGAGNPSRYPPITAGAHWRGKILAARQISAKAS